MNTVSQIVDALNNNDFNRVRRIVNSSNSTTRLPSRDFLRARSELDNNQKPNVENIKNDRGNGRISEGMRFLELVSLSFTGRNIDSVLKFDRVPIFINPKNFLLVRNNNRKIELISISLGFFQFMPILRQADNNFFVRVTDRYIEVFNSVTSGNFIFEDFRDLLPLMRVAAKKVESFKGEVIVNGVSVS